MAFGISAGTAALIGGGLSAVGSIVGGSMASDAASSAANAQSQAAAQATAEQRRQFDINQANQAPWLAAGKNALAQLNGGNFDVSQTPGYQFRLSEGLNALDRTAAARGGLMSGAALKAATRYGQDYASNEYTNAYNRIASQAGLGQTAANNLGAYGQQYASNIGNILGQGANAAASGYVGSANAWNQALGGATNALGQGFANYYANQPYSGTPGTSNVSPGIRLG